VTITITPEIERGLTEEAQRQGMTPETLALDTLQERFMPVGNVSEGFAYDLFAGRVGGIHSGGGNWPEDCGEKFAAGMVKKRQQGRL
jgi:hypothetical protein